MQKLKIILTGEQIEYLVVLLQSLPEDDPRLEEIIQILQTIRIEPALEN